MLRATELVSALHIVRAPDNRAKFGNDSRPVPACRDATRRDATGRDRPAAAAGERYSQRIVKARASNPFSGGAARVRTRAFRACNRMPRAGRPIAMLNPA